MVGRLRRLSSPVLLPPTTSPTTSPTSSPPADDDCTVRYQVRDQWATGFTAEVTVTDHGRPPGGRTPRICLPGQQRVGNGWSATWSQSGPERHGAQPRPERPPEYRRLHHHRVQRRVLRRQRPPSGFKLNGIPCGAS